MKYHQKGTSSNFNATKKNVVGALPKYKLGDCGKKDKKTRPCIIRLSTGTAEANKIRDSPSQPLPRFFPVSLLLLFYFYFFASRTVAMAFTAPSSLLRTPAAARALETRHFLLFFLMPVDIAKSSYKWLIRPAGWRTGGRPTTDGGGGPRVVGSGGVHRAGGGGGRRAEI